MLMKQIIESADAPKAVGPYSQAIRIGELLFASGQIPLDPQTGKLVSEDFAEQAAQVFRNVHAVLEAAHMDFNHVIKTTVFLTDLAYFETMNDIFADCFGDASPARSTVQVAALPLGAQIEVEIVAHAFAVER